MRTIQAVARYFPEACGGIQIHLSELIPAMRDSEVSSQVVAAIEGEKSQHYTLGGVDVYRYPVTSHLRHEPSYGVSPHPGFSQFKQWLTHQNADIYHQHQWTPKCGLQHLKLAKSLGLKTVVSIRLPEPICQRKTLMLNGTETCDGKIDPVKCCHCTDPVSKSIPPALIHLVSHIPAVVLSKMPLPAGVDLPLPVRNSKSVAVRPFLIPAYIRARQHGLQEMVQYADRIVVMCRWLYDALLVNQVPTEKLALCTHGIVDRFKSSQNTPKLPDEKLKIVFLGRWTAEKGIHILVDAIQSLPQAINLELVIHGIPQDAEYQSKIVAKINGDHRIKVAPSVSRGEVAKTLEQFHVLAVPSQWLETGPVVAMEAHAVGLPVVGSNLGGIAEKVRHGIDGLLVSATDTQAWGKAFEQLATDMTLLERLRTGIAPVRTIAMEAQDMSSIYQKILSTDLTRQT